MYQYHSSRGVYKPDAFQLRLRSDSAIQKTHNQITNKIQNKQGIILGNMSEYDSDTFPETLYEPQRGRSNSLPTLPSMSHLTVQRSIHQVWDILSKKVREAKGRHQSTVDEYYGKQDRMVYLSSVKEALKVTCDCGKAQITGNFLDLEELLKISPKSTIRPKQLQNAQETINTFMDQTKILIVRLTEAKQNVTEEVLCPLEMYCSSYTQLGKADDNFFKSLKERIVSIKTILTNFANIALSLRDTSTVDQACLTDTEFSQEVALEFDCEKYPVLRIVPDLIQKVEQVFDIAQDWIRSDRVYLEQLQCEICKTDEIIKQVEFKAQMAKLEYERMFSLLNQKQAENDEIDESFDFLWKSISKLDAAKNALEMEISVVGRTLHNCRDELRDLTLINHAVSQEKKDSDSDEDEVDCAAPDENFQGEMKSGSLAYSSKKSQLCRNARVFSTKLGYLKKQKRCIVQKIEQRRCMIQDLEESDNEIEQLSKKLRSIGKKKSKLEDKLITLKSQQDALRHTVDTRMHPQSTSHEDSKLIIVPRRKSTGQHEISHSKKPTKGLERTKVESRTNPRHSADLHKAFRVVKNGIGHNWKDLVRVLPYSPSKQQAEINNEISVIEYENQGQLKEQAYQAMVQWHNHNGRRASINVLKDSLREIQENRLAENIEKMAVGRLESVSA